MIHLCNNFIASKVHSSLIRHFADMGEQQYVLVPVRRRSDINKNFVSHKNITIDYFFFENRFIRFFPLLKIFYIFFLCLRFLLPNGNNSKEDIYLAHNFWSDGMVLFLFSFFKKIKYALVVRKTDINTFIPRLPHYHWLMGLAIKRSEGIVFVNPSYYQRFKRKWPKLFQKATRVRVIPNGVDGYWHKHKITNKESRPLMACFVGQFDHIKNVVRVIRACKDIAKDYPLFRLALVGGELGEIRKLFGKEAIPQYVKVCGFLRDKKELMHIYRRSRVFVMPSLIETFGLVYLEALSQGCAIVCTKDEGIDGLFQSQDVVAVNPRSIAEIEQSLRRLLQSNYEGLDPEWVRSELQPFQWRKIAGQYLAFLQ